MDFYQKIECLLKDRGLTRKEMCTMADINYNTLTGMVNRKSTSISMDMVSDIAKFFDVTVDYLIRDEIENPKGLITDRQIIQGKDIKVMSKNESEFKELDELPKEAQEKIREYYEMIKNKYLGGDK